jgi:hypothetical protein
MYINIYSLQRATILLVEYPSPHRGDDVNAG